MILNEHIEEKRRDSLCLSVWRLFVFHPEGKSKTREARQSIISPDWNFEKMGIGGLDKEFSDIFRRAFASRVFPPDIIEQMGEFPRFLFSTNRL